MNHSSHYAKRKLIWLVFTIIMVTVWASSCQPGSVTPVTDEPLTETPTTEPTEEPTTEPTQESDRQQCDGGDGTFTCIGDREIKLEGVPGGVTPYLLAIAPEFREFLLGPDAAKSPETTCIFMLAGDLAFYDENDKLVTSFDPAVTIKYAFLPQDQDAFSKCQEEVAPAAQISPQEVNYVPVYYDKDLWKAFKVADINPETGLMTITFTSWSDQPIGGGSQP